MRGPERFNGKGEQLVLRLAHQLRAVVLVNEGPAWRFAVEVGLVVVHVTGWIVHLATEGIITPGTGLEAVNTVERGQRTSQAFIDQARAALHRLLRGEQNG